MGKNQSLLIALVVLLFASMPFICWSQVSSNEFKNYPDDELGSITTQIGLPTYDINTDPISAWFIKKDTTYIGFIIAGHAEKAICEVASLEIANKTEKLDIKNDAVFSFGIGYNFNTDQKQIVKYHNIIKGMKAKFKELELQTFASQVTTKDVDYEEYKSKQQLIKSHINLANLTNEWDTHIVEYKLMDYPIITPFYDTNTSNEITFEVPKALFGEIPNELAYREFRKNLQKLIEELSIYLDNNNKAISRIRGFKINEEDYQKWNIEYYSFNNKVPLKNEVVFKVYTSFKTYGFTLEDDKNSVLDNEITLKEMKEYIQDINITLRTSPEVMSRIRLAINEIEEEIRNFTPNKNKLIKKIEVETLLIQNYLNDLNELSDFKTDDFNYIIDAFLRGWAFNTDDDNLNNQLDNWYLLKRKVVWDYILSELPNAKVNDKLGGLFHADDVFFKVKSEGNLFKITPYKITGGNFAQVIDKEIGISYLTSPLNHRYSKN